MTLPFLNTGIISGSTAHSLGGLIGGWVELGRTTLGCSNSNIQVSSIADKRYYMILRSTLGASGTADGWLRVGNCSVDACSNYAQRSSTDGCTDNTSSPINRLDYGHNMNDTTPMFNVTYIANRSASEKLFITHRIDQQTAGAANAPQRYETVSKWTNTSNPIDILEAQKQCSQTFSSGSEIVVLGWDPADTHNTNFWEELASADLSGGTSDTLSSGSFTAKKYLWVQAYIKPSGGTAQPRMRYNSDTTTYAGRWSRDGGTDSTETSADSFNLEDTISTPYFINGFIINNSSNEKLGIFHTIDAGSAGSANAPSRQETVSKHDETGAQITEISLHRLFGTGTFGTESLIKVWGAD
jgi:hypothetical protein